MNQLRAALDELPNGRSILMYGEPWQGGSSALHRYEANKNNLSMLSDRIAVFCDNTRDAIKGSCFDARMPGYVEGHYENCWDIGASVAAWCRSDRLHPKCPGQIISYVSAHDNFTLWDKLMLVHHKHPDFNAEDPVVLAQNRLAAGIYLTCMGIPFLQAGEEFARSKRGHENSYRSPIAINRLDWFRAERFHSLVDYYRGLIALRAAFPRLSATDRQSAQAIDFLSTEPPIVGWQLDARPNDGARWKRIAVFYNPTNEEQYVDLPEGEWKLLCDGASSSLWRWEHHTRRGYTRLLPYSTTILGIKQDVKA
jgi:pullulanase